jgi:pimeloyl-ACP methyl ester carboxylesterase
MFANMFFDPKYDALRDRLAVRGAAVPADAAVATYLAMLDWDANRCAAAFDAVSVPVMVLQSTTRDPGEDRRPLKPGEMAPYQKMIMERIEGAQTESFPGVGHFTMIEAADTVNACIRNFIDARASE